MNIKDQRKINRTVSIQKVLQNALFTILILGFVYAMFSSFFPDIVNINNTIFRVVLFFIFIYLLFKNFNDYQKYVEHLNFKDSVARLKREDNAKEKLYFFVMEESKTIDTAKVKIDILKSFTPVPFMIFLLGVLWDSKLNFLEKLVEFDISIKETFILVMFIIIIYYIYSFRSVWVTYKSAIDAYYTFKYEYDIYKK
ncbi:hypothetical protein [Rummeliibacillus sp. BSL5]